MKTFKINVNGQDYTVRVENPNAPTTTVWVDDHEFKVTVTEQVTRVARVKAAEEDEELIASYAPVVTTTFVETDAEEAPAQAAPDVEEGGEKIVAPMPGKVMDIAVKVGDKVKHGDTLCNLEAMKMKSPIRSTVEGTVAQVLITEGQNVNHGDVLFVLR